MSHHSNAEPKDGEDLKKDGADPETPVHESGAQEGSYDSRKKNLSKREIMEELSRARFPWEE